MPREQKALALRGEGTELWIWDPPRPHLRISSSSWSSFTLCVVKPYLKYSTFLGSVSHSSKLSKRRGVKEPVPCSHPGVTASGSEVQVDWRPQSAPGIRSEGSLERGGGLGNTPGLRLVSWNVGSLGLGLRLLSEGVAVLLGTMPSHLWSRTCTQVVSDRTELLCTSWCQNTWTESWSESFIFHCKNFLK